MLHKKTVLVKEAPFYVKKLLFLQIERLYKYIFCKKVAFLCKKAAFLQINRL